MTLWRLITRGLVLHRRDHLAVALGVVVATAVLSGALIVGDSVRGSLRDLAVGRLGRIDDVLVVDRFFRVAMVDELAASEGFRQHFDVALPAVMLPATLAHPGSGRRASQVNLLGTDAAFWDLGSLRPDALPAANEIVLNEPLARQIGARVGDDVLLRLTGGSDIPADSPLGRKTELIRKRQLRVVAIVPAAGLGRFSLSLSQTDPANAYVPLATPGDLLEQPDRANAILVARSEDDTATDQQAERALAEALKPALADYGIEIDVPERGYLRLTSERMMLEPAVVAAAERAARKMGVAADGVLTDTVSSDAVSTDTASSYAASPVLAYLANTIAVGQREIPYSTVAALDFTAPAPLGPFRSADGATLPPLAAGEIALNSWAAEDLEATVGDTVRLVYFEPESTHGEVSEQTAEFRLAVIVEISGAAADRDLVPTLRGVTDNLSMVGWSPPFPFDAGRVRPDKDEAYWDDYGTTPKAFVSLAEGRRLWGSRFGDTTSLRFVAKTAEGELTAASLAAAIDIAPQDMGFTFLSIRREAIRASTGTTPFEGLFLGFSMFLIAAAAMLVALLFRLGSEQRAAESGILLAVGFPPRRAGRVRLVEGLVVSVVGALVGTLAGVAYAALMLWGLKTWWLDAITTPFLELHVRPVTLAIGTTSGVLVAVVTILWAQLRLGRLDVCRLLAGVTSDDATSVGRGGKVSRWVAGGALIGAVASVAAATSLQGEMQAIAFFGTGTLVLTAALAGTHIWLRREAIGGMITAGLWPRARLAVRNAARHPGRSVLAIALTATACFLIVAISAFRLDPLAESSRDGGSGGFSLMARSDAAIYHDLGDEVGQLDLSLNSATSELLNESEVYSLRVRDGDDASCLNLYQTRDPRVLAVPDALVERGGFGWASYDRARLADGATNPWTLLDEKIESVAGVAQIPVVIDAATAIYGLHLSGVGDGLEMSDGRGQSVRFVVVGLLKNSVFQGDLVIGDAAFRRHFPQVSGFRSFLFAAPAGKADDLATALERDLGDWGFDVEPTAERLAGLLAVQNTYLLTFQSLGGLGLLLGTFGLAVVQLRNVLERRGELALLRATGYPRFRLAQLVVLENGVLLVGGLLIGTAAATATLVPHWLSGGAHVPWLWLILTLAAVLVVGLLASIWAVRAVLAAPLVPALRGE